MFIIAVNFSETLKYYYNHFIEKETPLKIYWQIANLERECSEDLTELGICSPIIATFSTCHFPQSSKRVLLQNFSLENEFFME